MSDKKGLLPYVSEEIGFALQGEILEKPGNEYVVEILQRLTEDNPHVANFIATMSLNSDGSPLHSAYLSILVYRLLESQADADKMKSELEKMF